MSFSVDREEENAHLFNFLIRYEVSEADCARRNNARTLYSTNLENVS